MSDRVAVNALLLPEDANALADLMKWRSSGSDLSGCIAEAIHVYRRLLKARREGMLVQLFSPDGRIEDVEIRA